MSSKLLTGVTVCLTTLLLMTPALIMAGQIWQHHIQFVHSSTFTSSPYTVNSLLMLTYHEAIASIILSFIVFFTIGIVLGILLHAHYLGYRTTLLKTQIEMLERVWQQQL